MATVTDLNRSNERKNNSVKFHRAAVNLVFGDTPDFHSYLRISDLPLQIKTTEARANTGSCIITRSEKAGSK